MECGLKIYRICPIRIEIIYGRGKFVGDFSRGKICTYIVTHIKIYNKLTPSINYFLNICQPMLKLKTRSGFHDLFRFWYV